MFKVLGLGFRVLGFRALRLGFSPAWSLGIFNSHSRVISLNPKPLSLRIWVSLGLHVYIGCNHPWTSKQGLGLGGFRV